MMTLDVEPGLVKKRCSIVTITTDKRGRAYGELRRMESGVAKPTSVPDSRFSQQ
jgi:hypothetical protein